MVAAAYQARSGFVDLKRSIRKIELALEKLEGGATSSRSAMQLGWWRFEHLSWLSAPRVLSELANCVAKAERSRIAKLAAQRSRERRWLEWASFVHEESAQNGGDVYVGEFDAGIAKVFWKGRLAGHVADRTSRFRSFAVFDYMAFDPLMKVLRNGHHHCLERAIQQVIDEIEYRILSQKLGK